jgi:hypothetical protein
MILVLSTLLAACAPIQSVPAAEAPAPDPTEQTQPELEGITILYHKTGCFAGVDLTLTVYDDGQLVLVDRDGSQREHQIAVNELEALRTLLADPEWEQVLPEYQAMGADLCVYAFTIPVPDGPAREVRTMDAAQPPPIVEQLREEMDRLLGLVPAN